MKRIRIRGSHGHVAPHATRLLGHGNKRWSTKAGLLLLCILNLWWGTQTYVVLDNWETKIVSVFSLLKCEHALVKKQNFQLIRATYDSFGWKTMCLSGKESMLMKISHNHKWDFGCQHFVSKQPFRGNTGSNKIEENHSKCINLTQVSVLS